MIRQPLRSIRTDILYPSTALFRSAGARGRRGLAAQRGLAQRVQAFDDRVEDLVELAGGGGVDHLGLRQVEAQRLREGLGRQRGAELRVAVQALDRKSTRLNSSH